MLPLFQLALLEVTPPGFITAEQLLGMQLDLGTEHDITRPRIFFDLSNTI